MGKLEELQKELESMDESKKEPNNINTKIRNFFDTKENLLSDLEEEIESLETEIKEKTQFLSQLKEQYEKINTRSN